MEPNAKAGTLADIRRRLEDVPHAIAAELGRLERDLVRLKATASGQPWYWPRERVALAERRLRDAAGQRLAELRSRADADLELLDGAARAAQKPASRPMEAAERLLLEVRQGRAWDRLRRRFDRIADTEPGRLERAEREVRRAVKDAADDSVAWRALEAELPGYLEDRRFDAARSLAEGAVADHAKATASTLGLYAGNLVADVAEGRPRLAAAFSLAGDFVAARHNAGHIVRLPGFGQSDLDTAPSPRADDPELASESTELLGPLSRAVESLEAPGQAGG